MRQLVDEFLSYLAVERGSSPNTVSAYRRDLTDYVAFLTARGVVEPSAVSEDDVTDWIVSLRSVGLAPASVQRKVSAVKSFHRFLVREELTENHPTARLSLPKKIAYLPDVISIEDAEKLLSQPFPDGPIGLRDRALLEVLYGCGLRASEAVGLNLADIHQPEGFITVVGKGDKKRPVPVTGMAEHALQAYLCSGRQNLRTRRSAMIDGAAVFLNARGGRLSRQALFRIVRAYGARVGLVLHPHTLRHSYATRLLEGGANLLEIQEILGHSDISTTQIYTHVNRQHMREEYLSTHPRARMR
jgi:integrase/recombinase XerD